MRRQRSARGWTRWGVALAAALGLMAGQVGGQTPGDSMPKHPDELPLETTDTMRFTASEGSWISVDVSPDGSTVVFDLLGDLYTVPLSGGPATRLTHGQPWDAQPRFSPDGTRIVFVSDRSGSKNLWTLDVASGEMKAVTRDGSSGFMSPEWLDDEYLVVSKGTRLGGGLLQVLHVDGGEGRRLFGDPQPPPPNRAIHVSGAAPSADGRYIWYAQAVGRWDYNAMFPEAQLGVYDRETGSARLETSRYGSGFRPTLSPDGKWLVYGTRHETETALRIRNLETGDEEWLAYPVQHDELESSGEVDVLPGMSFTPDSREVVASYGGRIWRVPVDGSAPVEVPFQAEVELPLAPTTRTTFRVDDSPELVAKEIRDLAPSPDGRRLAFVAMDRLWVAGVDGGEPVQLTPDSLSVAWPTWSPDGRRLAVAAWTDQGGSLVSVSADGRGGVRALTRRTGFYATPAWSPDGNRIVAARGPRRPFLLTPDPGAAGQAPDLVWVPAEGGEDVFIAPSQGRGAPHFVDGSDRIHLYHPGRGIVSIRWDGTDERGVVRVVGAPSSFSGGQPVPAGVAYLSPNGKKALAQVHNELFVVDVPVVGGATPAVNVASPAFPVKRITEMGAQFPAWGRDGVTVHWGLGNAHFVYDLDAAKAFADSLAAAAREAPTEEPGEAEAEPEDAPAEEDEAAAEEEEKEEEPATYKPTERRVEVRATRDVPRGEVLLRGARVITMRGDEILERGDVLVRDNRIAAVGPAGSVQAPEGARVMELNGATIVPGFVDTHAHLNGTFGIHKDRVWAYEANLAYGVTTVRDPQTGTTDVLSYADRVEAGEILGPRVYSTGPGVFGDYVTEKIRSLEHARNILRRYAEYFDTKTIKMYMAGTRKERQWISQAAREVGLMPTTEGGLRWQQDLTMMVDGYGGQEHNLPVFPVYSDVVRLAARTRIAYTPTLVVTYNGPWAENYYFTTEDLMGDEKLWRFIPREDLDGKVRRRIRPYLGQGPWGGWFLDEEYTFPRHARFVSDLMDAGGVVGVGSHGQLQGLGYHWELWSIQSGGLSEHGALRAATLSGAEAIGLAEDLGSIEVGKLADLVILGANPLENIRNSRAIRYVMKNGRLYDGDTLDEVWPRNVPFHRSWQDEGEPATRAGIR